MTRNSFLQIQSFSFEAAQKRQFIAVWFDSLYFLRRTYSVWTSYDLFHKLTSQCKACFKKCRKLREEKVKRNRFLSLRSDRIWYWDLFAAQPQSLLSILNLIDPCLNGMSKYFYGRCLVQAYINNWDSLEKGDELSTIIRYNRNWRGSPSPDPLSWSVRTWLRWEAKHVLFFLSVKSRSFTISEWRHNKLQNYVFLSYFIDTLDKALISTTSLNFLLCS